MSMAIGASAGRAGIAATLHRDSAQQRTLVDGDRDMGAGTTVARNPGRTGFLPDSPGRSTRTIPARLLARAASGALSINDNRESMPRMLLVDHHQSETRDTPKNLGCVRGRRQYERAHKALAARRSGGGMTKNAA